MKAHSVVDLQDSVPYKGTVVYIEIVFHRHLPQRVLLIYRIVSLTKVVYTVIMFRRNLPHRVLLIDRMLYLHTSVHYFF